MMATNTITITSNPENLKEVRSYIKNTAEESGFSEKDINDIILAVDEACTNIIRHAYNKDYSREIIISTDTSADKFTITLQDFGEKPDLEKIQNPPSEKLRRGGYGTVFIKKLMDEIDYDLSPEQGTILRLVKYKKS